MRELSSRSVDINSFSKGLLSAVVTDRDIAAAPAKYILLTKECLSASYAINVNILIK
jgi:hypothetical protein